MTCMVSGSVSNATMMGGGVHLDLGSSGTCLRPKVRPHVDCGETAKRPPGLGALQHRAPAHSQKHDF